MAKKNKSKRKHDTPDKPGTHPNGSIEEVTTDASTTVMGNATPILVESQIEDLPTGRPDVSREASDEETHHSATPSESVLKDDELTEQYTSVKRANDSIPELYTQSGDPINGEACDHPGGNPQDNSDRVAQDNNDVSAKYTEALQNGSVDDVEHKLQQVSSELLTARQALLAEQASNHRISEEKSQIESQYRSLFGKVAQMKTNLAQRLKQDAEELAHNKTMIDDLEQQNAAQAETISHLQDQVVECSETSTTAVQRLSICQREMDDVRLQLQQSEMMARSENDKWTGLQQKNASVTAEWENLAIEERSARDALRDRIQDLEEQLSAQNSAYDNLRLIVDQDNQAITKFKQNIYELQEAHKAELRDTVEKMQNTTAELNENVLSAENRAKLLRLEVQSLNVDLEKLRPFELEAKEKNLLIGKLRHEAVILNEHLTKALRLLKRGSTNDTVDRQLINNLLLSFLTLPRQDSKRFEVLKILSSVLSWSDEQKELAGLLRPGTSGSFTSLGPLNTKSPPSSPVLNRHGLSRRTSGSLQLQAADFMGPNRESMSDLWINFLQSEAAANTADAVEIPLEYES